MAHNSVLRCGDYGTDHQVDLTCTAQDCRADADQDAPVPLCTQHLRLAFAYVMTSAAAMSDEAPDPMPMEKQPRRGQVYFMRKGDLIKIGWSAHPEIRRRRLGADMILATTPGTMQDERALHLAFSDLRVHGEWFRPGEDLLYFIDNVKAKSA